MSLNSLIKHPFLIQDTRNPLAYKSLILGLVKENPKIVELALKSGAKVEHVLVAKNLNHSGKWSRPKHEKESFISLEKYALQNCSSEIYALIFNKLPQKDETGFVVKYLLDRAKNFKESKKYSSDREVAHIIKKYIQKDSVNASIKIYELSRPYDKGWSSERPSKISLLSYACFCGNLEAVRYLFSLGAKANVSGENVDAISALFEGHSCRFVSDEVFLDILNLLIKNDVDLKKKEKGSKISGLDKILELDSSDLKIIITRILQNQKRG